MTRDFKRDYPEPKYLATTIGCNQEKGNNPMFDKYDRYNDLSECDCEECRPTTSASTGVVINAPPPSDIPEEQRKFIGRAALDVIDDKTVELLKKFKIDFDYRPKTVQEAAQRLKDGLYTMDGADKTDPVWYCGLNRHFSWRGPDDQPDQEGYDKAKEELDKFVSPLLMEIRVFDPKDGLESFNKLKAYQI